VAGACLLAGTLAAPAQATTAAKAAATAATGRTARAQSAFGGGGGGGSGGGGGAGSGGWTGPAAPVPGAGTAAAQGLPGGGPPLANHAPLSPAPGVIRPGHSRAGSATPDRVVPAAAGPSVPTSLAYSPNHGSEDESLAPTFSATYTYSGGSGYVQFEVLNSGGTVVNSGNGSTVASGATSSWTLSGTQLSVGQTYSFQARAVSGSSDSAWSAAVSFVVDPRLSFGVHPWQTDVKVPIDSSTAAMVNVASGELTVASNALTLPGAGLPFTLNFYSNSTRTGGSGSAAPIAFDWVDNLSTRLDANPDGAVTYFDQTGGTATFTKASGSAYNSPGSVPATLATVSGGGWTLTFHSSGATYAQGEIQTFNSSGELTKEAAATGEAITISYTNGEPTSVTDTEGRTISLGYNSSLQPTSVDDTASGRTWTVSYNSSGYLSSITDPDSNVTSFGYASNGDITSIAAPGSRTIDIAYNSAQQVSTLTQVGSAGSPAWTFNYASSTTTQATDPDGDTTTYTSDNADRVTKTTDALGQNRSTTWTSDNNVASAADAQSNVSAFTWDSTTDVLDKESLPTGAAGSWGYEDTGNPYVPTKSTDPQGNSVSYSYDTYGQVDSAADSQSSQNTSTATYQGVNGALCGGKAGQVCSVTTPDGNTTKYAYNSSGELTTITPPSPLGSTALTYTADGNPKTTTDGNGNTTTYTWNGDDEMTNLAPQTGSATSYGYDSDGDLTSRSGGAGTQSLTWNNLGELATSQGTAGDTTSYGYDAIGNITSVADANGTTSYKFNQVNDPTTVSDPWGGTTSLGYVSGNDTELASITFPNGDTESFGYDKSKRLTSISAAESCGCTLLKATYSYTSSSGADSALLQQATDTAGDTTSYGYDSLDRLKSATTSSSSGSAVSSYSYGYDGDGDQTSADANGTSSTYTYNSADELTSQSATYDSDGDLTGGAGFDALTYNADDQTTSVKLTCGCTTNLSYVGNTQDQLAAANGDSTNSFDDNALGIESSVTNGTTTGYLYTPEGRLLAEHVNGATYYYLLGNLGSVLGVTGSSGSLVNQYTYAPYGQQTTVQSGVSNLFGYAAALDVPGTNLLQFGARYYSPADGQWTQQDPTGQNSGYYYAGDNPVSNVDPAGTDFLDLDFQVCLGICISGGAAENSDGSWLPELGVGAGPDVGVDFSATINTGSAEAGPELDGSCNVGPLEADASTSGGGDYSYGAGLTTATDEGCEAGATYVY
jgi:RHS repeat-associated protein